MKGISRKLCDAKLICFTLIQHQYNTYRLICEAKSKHIHQHYLVILLFKTIQNLCLNLYKLVICLILQLSNHSRCNDCPNGPIVTHLPLTTPLLKICLFCSKVTIFPTNAVVKHKDLSQANLCGRKN